MRPLPRLLAALPDPSDLEDRRWSVVSLLVVNTLPLLGVLCFGWRVFDVVFAYWVENVVIGVVNLLKILTAFPDPEAVAERAATLDEQDRVPLAQYSNPTAAQASKLFLAPFFAIHYGGFCLGHGLFVCALAGGRADPFTVAFDAVEHPYLWLTAAALLTSHLVSYFTNYLGRGEYRRVAPIELMMQPYGRVVLLHVALLASGFLTVWLGTPVWLLLLLVVGKTALDLKLHLREHRRAEAGA